MTYHDKSSSRHHCWKHGTLGHFGTFFRTPWHWALSNRPKASWNSSTWAWQMQSPWQLPNSCSNFWEIGGEWSWWSWWPWWSWTTLHARASVREMDLFDKSTWSQNRPIERCVLLCCMAYCCCLHFSLVLVQGLCNKPSRLQLSVCREQNSSLSDISA